MRLLVNYDDVYDTFINEMNEQIERYKKEIIKPRKKNTSKTPKE